MPTRLWDVHAALLVLCRAATPNVKVFDGPVPRGPAPPTKFVLVGSDGGETGYESGEDGLVSRQAASRLGNNWRDEAGDVLCAAWAWSGDTNLAPLRAAVTAITDAIETAIQTDRSLGGVLEHPGLAEVTEVRFTDAQTPKGAVSRAVFTVSYGALLTT